MLQGSFFFGCSKGKQCGGMGMGVKRQVSLSKKLKTSSYHRFFVVVGISLAWPLVCVWPFKVASQLQKSAVPLEWQRKETRSFLQVFWCSGSYAQEDRRWRGIDHVHVLMSGTILCGKWWKKQLQCLPGHAVAEKAFAVGEMCVSLKAEMGNSGGRWRPIGHCFDCFCVRVCDGSECDSCIFEISCVGTTVVCYDHPWKLVAQKISGKSTPSEWDINFPNTIVFGDDRYLTHIPTSYSWSMHF